MNQLIILVVALVVFVYFGGKYVPKVLKDNKQIMLGLVGGVVLCSFMCKSFEGFDTSTDDLSQEVVNVIERNCNHFLHTNPAYCNSSNEIPFSVAQVAELTERTGPLQAGHGVHHRRFTDCEYCRNLPPTTDSGCVDGYTTDTCNQYISHPDYSCDDFAPDGAYPGGCDKTCNLCGSGK